MRRTNSFWGEFERDGLVVGRGPHRRIYALLMAWHKRPAETHIDAEPAVVADVVAEVMRGIASGEIRIQGANEQPSKAV